MPEIPENIIVMWPGTNGSWPSGWSEVTALANRFPYGASNGADGGSNAGSDTHSNHSCGSHTHSTSAHTHSFSTPNFTAGNIRDSQSGNATTTLGNTHSHSGTSGSAGSGTSGGGSSSTSSGSSLPSYYSMVFIKSDGTPSGFPDDCVVFWNSTTAPTGWGQHGGSVGKFIRGTSSGGNGGGTGGGSHNHSTNSHSHGGVSHDHAAATSGNASPTVTIPSGYPHTSNPNHTHSVDLSSGSPSLSGAGGGTSGSTSYEPPYRSLWGLENTSGGDSWLEEAIVLWVGSYSSIPDDWVYCNGSNGTPDMRDKFIKTSGSGGSTTTTGGGNGHSHSAPGGHGHGWSHTHSFGTTGSSGNINLEGARGGADQNYAYTPGNEAHTHGGGNSGSGGGTGSSSFSFGSSGDSRPASHTVIYLMAPEEPSAGGNVAMFGANF